MDKSMSKEDAILWIKNIINDIGSPKHSDLWGYEETLYEIQKLLKEDSAQQWIPCSERLPDVGTPVLGSFEVEGDRYILGTSICVIYGEKAWTGTMGIKPIAWMPLPEPYKGENDG